MSFWFCCLMVSCRVLPGLRNDSRHVRALQECVLVILRKIGLSHYILPFLNSRRNKGFAMANISTPIEHSRMSESVFIVLR